MQIRSCDPPKIFFQMWHLVFYQRVKFEKDPSTFDFFIIFFVNQLFEEKNSIQRVKTSQLFPTEMNDFLVCSHIVSIDECQCEINNGFRAFTH